MRKTNNWYLFAEEDLLMAEIALENNIYNQVCFHSQQGGEKILKGYLLEQEKIVPRTHFLSELVQICIKVDSDFQTITKECSILDDYYIPTRYPDALPGMLPDGLPTDSDAFQAILYSKKIYDFVTKKRTI